MGKSLIRKTCRLEYFMASNEKRVRPFGMRDKIGYLLGDFGNDFTFMLSSLFLLKYYTDVMEVSAGVVGVVMMVSRFVDAFTDITMGRIVDGFPAGKGGKFKPWLLCICIPVALFSFLIYQSQFADASQTFKIVWLTVTYLLWGSFFYTAINIPYGSMASAISAEPADRASLSTYRTIGSTLAGLVIGAGIPILAYVTVDGKEILSGSRMTWIAGIFSILAIVCYLLCYSLVEERVEYQKQERKTTGGEVFRSLVQNKALLGLIFAAILLLFAQLTMSSMNNYVFPNFYRNAQAISVMSIAGNIAILGVCAPLTVPIARKIGKKELGVISCLYSAAVFLVAYIIRPANVWVFVALETLAQLGMGFFNMVVWAYITDVIDDAEIRDGRRQDGTIYSVYSFARKLGQALAAGLTGVLLSLIGYTKETAFDEAVTNGIFDITCLVTGLGFLACGLVLWFLYPLNKKKVEENQRILAEKR